MGGAKVHHFKVKRAYEQADPDDGFRVLVDRLWPRGLSKDKAHVDLWLKDVAPSDALRRRFHRQPGRWRAFVGAYAEELRDEPAASAFKALSERAFREPVTMLYAARDEEHNNAVALKELIETSNKK